MSINMVKIRAFLSVALEADDVCAWAGFGIAAKDLPDEIEKLLAQVKSNQLNSDGQGVVVKAGAECDCPVCIKMRNVND